MQSERRSGGGGLRVPVISPRAESGMGAGEGEAPASVVALALEWHADNNN